MPELPEVETTLRGLEPHLVGRTICSVIVRETRFRLPVNADLEQHLVGQKITHLSRRAKYMLIHLPLGVILVHLGMSGHLRMMDEGAPQKKHDHIELVLDDGRCLRFNDPRRFGLFLYACDGLDGHSLLKHLGPEPLSLQFHAEYLYALCNSKKAAIKSVIMSNDVVVGVGNIYATESLFLSRIHPETPAYRLNLFQCGVLVGHIKAILAQAINMGGTTLRDFYGADGKPGYFSLSLAVYGRQRQACFVCDAVIDSVKIAGRASAFCPGCQVYFK